MDYFNTLHLSSNRIFNMLLLSCLLWSCLLLISTSALSDDAVKNHRLEKRQDDSFMFFGGWRPMRQKSPFHHGSATGRYHDLLSALPDSLDTSSSYYTHALPKNFHKDIYSYYPRPAIKPRPKKNTPVYMETLKPQAPQKQNTRGYSNNPPQVIDLQKIDLSQFRGLHDAILQAKDLPFSGLQLPVEPGKQFEIVEVSLPALQQSGHQGGGRNIRYGGRNKGTSRNNKGRGGYGRVPNGFSPAQLPLQFQYVKVPKYPMQVPHSVPGLEEVVGLKNIQIIEVPVPTGLSYGSNKGKGSQYGKRLNPHSQLQYTVPAVASPQKSVFPTGSYFQVEQPRKQYSRPQQPKSNHAQNSQQAQIEAELFKLSDEEVKNLLQNLQVVHKNQKDLLKYLPIGDAPKTNGEDLQLIVALPDVGGQISEAPGYSNQGYSQESNQGGGYGNKLQYEAKSYPSPNTASVSQNSGGYHFENHGQLEHNAAGYKIEDQGAKGNDYEQPAYRQNDYGSQSGSPKGNYQEVEPASGYSQPEHNSPANNNGPQQYIQVLTPHTDDNGYRREPVLALEIQHGQTVEEAIKSLDPETLHRLGAHGKDGLEIEVVEIPMDEYSSESKKTETVVAPSTNITVLVKPKTTKTPDKKA